MGSVNGHPADGDWLRFADGELDAKQEKIMRAHLAACWQCRAALEEIQRSIGQCVQYRDSVLRLAYPDPPKPWFDIYREFDRIEERAAARSWFARFSEWLSPSTWTPRRTAFAALSLTLVALLVWQSWQLPAVQAATLLRRAVAHAETRPVKLQRIRLRTRHATLARTLGSPTQATHNTALTELETLFHQAHYEWNDPLSARAFQRWRSQLSTRHDEVTAQLDAPIPGDRYYRIRTTTPDPGELVAASLTLRATDLEPTSSVLEFRNHESIEIQPMPDEPLTAAASPNSANPEPAAARAHLPEPLAAAPTLRDELLVFKALHEIGADLDQPLQITRTQEAVQVTGVGVPAERRDELRAALDPLPRVRLQFHEAGSASLTQPERHLSNQGAATSAAIERLQGRLENALGGRAAFTQVADRALESSDNLLTRVHALRRLAERYSTHIEVAMTADERAILTNLRHDHAAAILAQTETLLKLLRPALRTVAGSPAPRSATGLQIGPWQAQTEQLFATGRQVDMLLAGTLAAAPTALSADSIPAELLARLGDLKAQAEGYEKMAREVQ